MQNQVNMIWYGSPFSCAIDFTISQGTKAIFLFNFHSRVPNGQSPFLRNTYKICHYREDNGNPIGHHNTQMCNVPNLKFSIVRF